METDEKEAQEAIQQSLSSNPGQAFARLPCISCPHTRSRLGLLIVRSWARQDINAAWSAVARSPLHGTEKQILFNELWG